MSTYPEQHNYTGYTQQSPDSSYNYNQQQQQEYQEKNYPNYEESPYQQQSVPPFKKGYYGYDTLGAGGQNALPGIDGSFAAGLTYLGFWLTGLLFLIFERKNRLVRFHAMQSLLLFGCVNALYFFFIGIMINQTPFIWGFAIFAFVVMNIIAAVSWFVGLIGAFGGRYTKLPFVGDIAERYVNRTTLK